MTNTILRRAALLTVAAIAAIGAIAQSADPDHDLRVAKNLEVFSVIYRNLDMLYVDTLNADETMGTAIDAMLESLDPYSEYYPESEQKDVRMMLTGKYAGIGSLIHYNYKLGRVIIDEPYEGMPAAAAGLRKGDIILSIDGEDVTGKDNAYVSEHLRGDAGTTFELKVKRPSTGKTLTMRITRRAIQLPAITYYGLQPNGYGYIALNQFIEDCSKGVRNAIIEMRQQGMKGLVFDLRGNGGGSEAEAVNIVNCFVPKGRMVVSNHGRFGSRDYKTQTEPVDTLLPVVVLVNGSSASASEITSGALQDLDRAVIMGTKTFGKGLVQTVMPLPYNGQMKLTTNKYYIPSGRCIQRLNYRHNAQGGGAVAVADSAKREFRTANGRPVFDGGGIMPDVEVKQDSMPNIAYYLTAVRDSDELVETFVEDYIAAHPTIAPAGQFSLTDDDYAEFKRRVLASRFKYDDMSSAALDNLEKIARFEGYYDGARAEFDSLRAKLRHNLAHDLDYNARSIRQLLQNDIVTAYYYQKGAVENALQTDKQVQAAFDLLGDRQRYDSLLRLTE